MFAALKSFAPLLLLGLAMSCKVSSLPVHKLEGKKTLPLDALTSLGSDVGPIQFTKIVAADWQITRSGLIDLENPKAKAAGIVDGSEPIQLYFYVIDHPQYGRFFIDSGLGQVFLHKEGEPATPQNHFLSWLANFAEFKIHRSTAAWLKDHGPAPLSVFLTHMHFDHILGLSDLPREIPVIVGPGETENRRLSNLAVQKSTNGLIGWKRPIEEIAFDPEHSPAAIDWFGDQSFYVIWVPGHTAGSLAFLVKSTEGPQLIIGDSSHTLWGWKNDVSPGTFSEFADQNRSSLSALIALGHAFPNARVHLGHQSATAKGILEEVADRP